MSAQMFLPDFTAGSRGGISTEAHRSALNSIFTAVYEELRRLASAIRRGDPGATLKPTALVNEAWFKLADNPALGLQSKFDFKRIAARAMRQLLIEQKSQLTRRKGDQL
ncbi:MAG: ECF-type sigma factor [Acidobacteriaceae bacterium]